VQPQYFSHAPAHPVTHHRSAQRSLDAEPKAALRQLVRFQEHGEVGTRSALSVAVNGVEVRFAHQLSRRDRLSGAARLSLPRFTRV